MKENKERKQSTFSQTLYNNAKKGAYFTNLEHCKALANFFDFSQAIEVCVLDPSIGDGSAVATIVDKENNPHVKIFGVELDQERELLNRKSQNIDYSINADFINGVEITNNAFSFCFGNPPYGESLTNIDRLEKAFLKKIIKYLKTNALLVWVVPYYVFLEDMNYAQILTNNFSIKAIGKFHESEFKKWQQVVIIARKKGKNVPDDEACEKVMNAMGDIDKVEEIPFDFQGKKLKVLPSKEDDIKVFSSSTFDHMRATEFLPISSLYDTAAKNLKPMDSILAIGAPPTEVKNDHLYLLAVSGYAKGIMGDPNQGDCHLQRGKVEMSKSVIAEQKEGSESIIQTTKTFAKSMLTIIENSGKITVLE